MIIQDVLNWIQEIEDNGKYVVGTQNVKRHLEEVQRRSLSENQTAITILSAVAKKLTAKIKKYEAQGKIGYAKTFKAARRLLYIEIEQLKTCCKT